MLRYATALVGPSHAEDVVSTVVLRVLRKRSLSDLEQPKSYLLKAVLNESRGVMRRRSTEPLGEVAADSSAAEVVDVVRAVRSLPVRQRAAVYFFYWEGLPVQEIANVMGISEGAIKRYLHLARKKLKDPLS